MNTEQPGHWTVLFAPLASITSWPGSWEPNTKRWLLDPQRICLGMFCFGKKWWHIIIHYYRFELWNFQIFVVRCVFTKFKDVTPNLGILHGGETPKNQPRPTTTSPPRYPRARVTMPGTSSVVTPRGDGCGMRDLNFNDIMTKSIKIIYTGMCGCVKKL